MEKKLNLTQQKHTFTNQKKCTTTQKTKPGLAAFYDIWPGNGAGLFKYGRRQIRKSEEKRISGEAYDINKQTIYTAPKSKIESKVHHAPEPAKV